LRKIMARSSVSLKAWGPLERSFSLGRSSSGHSLMVWYEAMRTSRWWMFNAVFDCHEPPHPFTTLRGSVQHFQCEPFEVFPFGVVQAYGMIDGLTKTFDEADFPSGVHGGAENDFLKQVGGEMLRARKS